MRIFQHANYPFMQWRRRAYVVTAVLLLAGVSAMVMNVGRYGSWLNYGVDFIGGTQVQLSFNQPVQAERIRAAAAAAGHDDWEITRFGSANEFIVRMRAFEGGLERTTQDVVTAALAAPFAAEGFSIGRIEAVSAKVGDELQYKALIAILLSFLVTMGYLWVRFEWRFGLAAIIATAHDIFITLGVLAMMGSEISLGTVAAFLTIVGYSLNDTIVVFDRIRENLGKPRHGMSYMEILNRSINETLPRTVLTASGTLATLLSLAVLGGPVIRDFAVVLILGILIGTFSSIFVASPALYLIEGRWPHKPGKSQQAAPSHSSRQRAARTTV